MKFLCSAILIGLGFMLGWSLGVTYWVAAVCALVGFVMGWAVGTMRLSKILVEVDPQAAAKLLFVIKRDRRI